MNRRTLFLLAIIGFGSTNLAVAQLYDHEFSYFEPLTEFEGFDAGPASGMFFQYDRLFWTQHSERATIGSETAQARYLDVWGAGLPSPGNLAFDLDGDGFADAILPLDQTENPFTPAFQLNGLNEVFPRADFQMGDRFEFGTRDSGGDEWFVSLTTPFDITQSANYGLGFTGQDETLGAFPNSNQDRFEGVDLDPDPDVITELTLATQLFSPFGNVVILFDYAPGMMHGFIDVFDGTLSAAPPGDVLQDDTNGDGFLDGDGIADDINQNDVFGPNGADLLAPAWIPETDIGFIDYGDMVELPTSFAWVDIRSTLETTGMQFMRAKNLSRVNSKTAVQFLYGLRYLRVKDEFFVFGQGGVLGDSYWDTEIRNNLFGPQIGARVKKTQGRWEFTADARGFASLNMEDWEQDVSIGEDLIPGQLNHSWYLPPTTATHGKRKYEFAPMGELRMTASYRLTKGMAFNVGYNGMFLHGIRRAATHVKYELPNMGFREGRKEQLFLNGVNLGVSFVH